MIYSDLYLNDMKKAIRLVPNINSLIGSQILVTGATGLIGSALIDFLMIANDEFNLNNSIYIGARNFNKVQARFGNMLGRKDLSFFPYDAIKPIKPNINFDYIIHAASPANPSLYAAQPVETMLANFEGLANILKYAKEHHSKMVCYISSSEVYGKKNDTTPYGETDYCFLDILNSRACYPSSKRAAETLLVSYLNEYNVPGVIVRPGHVFGPTLTAEDTRASSIFFTDVLNGKDIIMKSEGLKLRSYCYIVDAVSAIITIILNGHHGQAYNISNPNSIVTIKQFAMEISRQARREIKFELPSETEKKSYNLMDNSSLTSKKLESLGWKPIFDITTAIEHTLQILK